MIMACQLTSLVIKLYPKVCLRNALFRMDHMCLLSSSPTPRLKSTTKTLENLQVSKHLQPLINRSVDEILQVVDRQISCGESVTLLKALRIQILFKGSDSQIFKDDVRFKMLCDVFHSCCHRIEPSLLISGLRSLLEVGMAANDNVIVQAEESVLRSMYNFSSFNLIGCLYFHRNFTETNLQKNVVEALVRELALRVTEVSSDAEVLMLMHLYHLFDNEQKKVVEKQIIQIIPILNIHELCKMFTILSEDSNRNIPILSALAQHMKSNSNRPDLKETVDVLYASKKLSFCDPQLFAHLVNPLETEIANISQPSLISSLLTACGHLRWRHTGFLDACGKWIEKNAEFCRPREFIAYILTIAALNYYTPESKQTVISILSKINLDKLKAETVLDIAWSCCVLDVLPKELLLKVLSSDFYKPLIDNKLSTASNTLKLLNLKAVLQKKHPECIFQCEMFLEPAKLSESSDIEASRKHVIKVLKNFVPSERCLSCYQMNEMGFHIDAEFIMDKNMKPLPLSDYILGKQCDEKPKSKLKSLPRGSTRVCLMIMFHKDFTLCSTELTGLNSLAVRLLTEAKYKVVCIPYDEFSRNKTEVRKAKYLLQKITDTVKKENVKQNKKNT